MSQEHVHSESGNGQLPDAEARDADLTAFALEQLTADEYQAIKARLHAEPETLKSIDEIRTLARLLRELTSADHARPPVAAVRVAIEKKLDAVESATEDIVLRKRLVRMWHSKRLLLAASVVSATLLVGLSIQQLYYWTAQRKLIAQTNAPKSPAAQSPHYLQDDGQYQPLVQRESELAALVEQFNERLDERRYAVAEQIAQQAHQLDPNSEVVQNMQWQSRFVRRMQDQLSRDSSSERGFYDSADVTRFDVLNSVLDPSASGQDSSAPRGDDDSLAVAVDASAHSAPQATSEPTTSNLLTVPLGWRKAELSWDEGKWGDLSWTRPYRRPSTNEQYDSIQENGFVTVSPETALSTFSIDVDTASYANVRRFLNRNTLPPPDAVRIEELVNYFQYEYPQPRGRHPFVTDMEVAECPWKTDHLLLRIGLKGREVDTGERPSSNLVFLLDVSGSMQSSDKLPLLKRAMMMLVQQLTENDRVTIVTYAGEAGLRLDTTTGDRHAEIDSVIGSFTAGGSTNGSAGIELAYEKAAQSFIEGGTNRVILATDGDLNVGISDDQQLVQLIKEKARSGVFLTVLGFGTGNLKDSKLEKLADHGNGIYGYVDSLREARKVLVEQMAGSLVTIAKDVKIQVEFNPAEVRSYRLIGYENRIIAARDFHDDTKDAGEIGAGHTVTALYELEPTDRRWTANSRQPFGQQTRLKYQQTAEPEVAAGELTDAARSGELLTLSIRYKQLEGSESSLIEVPLKGKPQSFEAASDDFRFASMVAAFGMLLRNSRHCGDISFGAVEEWASSALGEDPRGRRTEFVDLVRRAKQLRQQ